VPLSKEFVDNRGLINSDSIPVLYDLLLRTNPESGEKKVVLAWYGYISALIDSIEKQQQNTRIQNIENNFSDWLSSLYVENIKIPQIFPNDFPELQELPISSGYIREMINNFATNIWDFRNPGVILPTDLSLVDENENDILITISGLSLINTNNSPWEQILEIRRNPKLKGQLRNLRLFAYENYKDKSKAFIIDDIAKRIDDYNSVCKEYAFETRNSCLSILIKADNLRFLGVAGIAAIILGEPLAASTAILGGACLDIGVAILEFSKRRRSLNKIKNHHEIAYIDNLKNLNEN